MESVLFLPGMMCDARLFGPQIEHLSALRQRCEVADFSRHDTIDGMAQHALDAAPERFALVGLSMGGIVAFEMWRRAPERIRCLALLDTNPYPDAPERRSLRLQQIRDVLDGRLREVAVEGLKPMYLAAAHRDDAPLLDLILDMAMALGPDVFERQSLALASRRDSVPTLATISCPTLVLCGAEDTLCPVAYHERMAADISHATLRVLPDCGHIASLEQPDAVNAALESLLAA